MGLGKYLLPPTVLAVIAGIVAAGVFGRDDEVGRALILGSMGLVFSARMLAPRAARLARLI